jgi:outer membrane protein assembly factor BamB
MARGSASVMLLAGLLVLTLVYLLAHQLVQAEEERRSLLRKTDEILAVADVRIRTAPDSEALARALRGYDEAGRVCPRRDYLRRKMLATATWMVDQARESAGLRYPARDLLKKMQDLGMRDDLVIGLYEDLEYQLERGKILWTFPLMAPCRSTPGVLEDRFICVYQGSRVSAQDTGKRGVWPELYDGAAPVVSDLLLAGGRVCFMLVSGQLVALDDRDGQVLWQKRLADRLYDKPWLASGGSQLYVLLSDGSLRAFSLPDGKALWEKSARSAGLGLLALDDRAVAVRELGVEVFDSSGRRLWALSWPEKSSSWAAASGNEVVVCSGRSLMALASDRGTPLWSFDLPAAASAQILGFGGRWIVPLETGDVIAVEKAGKGAGRIGWATRLEAEVGEAHKHDHDSCQGHDHDHSQRQAAKPGDRVSDVCRSAGAIAGGKLYLQGEDTLYCIDGATGELDWVYDGLGAPRAGVLVSAGRIYVSQENAGTKHTDIGVFNSGRASDGGWGQFGGSSGREFSR